MAFTLPDLPYPADGLAPHLSTETLELHHGKHHATYVDTLNELTEGELSDDDLQVLIRKEGSGKIFNQAAQHWNHRFYWTCMAPGGGGEPPTELAEALSSAFGSVDAFREQLHEAAADQFGSGWAWLVDDGSGLSITTTADADLPLVHDQRALLTIDVWEHAYYVDYRNRRPDYLDAFLDHLVDWTAVAARL